MAAEDLEKERVPYNRYAFGNVYNYTLLAGVGAAALLTGQWWMLIFGGAAEALWMLFAPDSKLLQRLWFDKVHSDRQHAARRQALAAKLSTLPVAEGNRVERLQDKREQILRFAADNQAFTQQLMSGELGKLEKLVNDFAELALAMFRNEAYLRSVDVRELEANLREQEGLVKTDEDPEARGLAQKNLAVLMRRRDKLAEIHTFVSRARAQMELIENTFELLADQIVTMRSPRELDGQLDELIDGVDAVRTTARETEALLEGVGK